MSREKITPDFFKRDPVVCARELRELIGCALEWHGCAGRIVETEAYYAIGDEACHTQHRITARRFVEDHDAGDAYVYLNYGVHWLFNILVKQNETHGFVLIRALEPIKGSAEMVARRGEMKPAQLASGPGKMTRALGISGKDHGLPFLQNEGTGLYTGKAVEKIISGPRIGISKATDEPWRFGEADSAFLSRKF